MLRARETVSVGKISGAVGMFAHLDPAIESARLTKSGPAAGGGSSQVISAIAMPSSCRSWPLPRRRSKSSRSRFADCRDGNGEVESRSARARMASSAMPHKRNPIGSEQVTGLARLIRANAIAAMENVAIWHGARHLALSVERVILPDSFIALDHMLRGSPGSCAAWSPTGAHERESRALARRRLSGTVLLELEQRGVSREQAYEWVSARRCVVSRAEAVQSLLLEIRCHERADAAIWSTHST